MLLIGWATQPSAVSHIINYPQKMYNLALWNLNCISGNFSTHLYFLQACHPPLRQSPCPQCGSGSPSSSGGGTPGSPADQWGRRGRPPRRSCRVGALPPPLSFLIHSSRRWRTWVTHAVKTQRKKEQRLWRQTWYGTWQWPSIPNMLSWNTERHDNQGDNKTGRKSSVTVNNSTLDLVKSKNKNATGSLPVSLKCFKQEKNYHNNIKKWNKIRNRQMTKALLL